MARRRDRRHVGLRRASLDVGAALVELLAKRVVLTLETAHLDDQVGSRVQIGGELGTWSGRREVSRQQRVVGVARRVGPGEQACVWLSGRPGIVSWRPL